MLLWPVEHRSLDVFLWGHGGLLLPANHSAGLAVSGHSAKVDRYDGGPEVDRMDGDEDDDDDDEQEIVNK